MIEDGAHKCDIRVCFVHPVNAREHAGVFETNWAVGGDAQSCDVSMLSGRTGAHFIDGKVGFNGREKSGRMILRSRHINFGSLYLRYVYDCRQLVSLCSSYCKGCYLRMVRWNMR